MSINCSLVWCIYFTIIIATAAVESYGNPSNKNLNPPLPSHKPNCYGFPDSPFTPSNYVSICDPSGCKDTGLGVQTGDVAPNFKLSSVNNTTIELYNLLSKSAKPIFIQFGSFT